MRNFLFVILLSYGLIIPLCAVSGEGGSESAGAVNTGSFSSEVEFSDDTKEQGVLSITPGRRLIVVSSGKRRELELEEIAQLDFISVKESLEYNWTFKEEGKVEKEKSQTPYPLKELSTRLRLIDGTVIEGDLQTTVFYLTVAEASKRIIYRSKVKGAEGDSLDSLVHLRSIKISHTKNATGVSEQDTVKLAGSAMTGKASARFITLPALTDGGLHKDGGTFRLDKASLKNCVLAVDYGAGVICYYPRSEYKVDAALEEQVRVAVNEAKDFFDLKEVLSVYIQAQDNNVYALVKLVRGRASTLKKEINVPWQLNVWRFRLDGEVGGQIMLAGRFVLARVLVASVQAAPPVTLRIFNPQEIIASGVLAVDLPLKK